MNLLSITNKLASQVNALRFRLPVTHVLNPLVYAIDPLTIYLERYGAGPKEVILLGMNPGPWGMVQTGVPFGEVCAVKDWLNVQAPINKPAQGEHPKRPIQGFSCLRSEVSGRRVWSWAQEAFGTPDQFFSRFFVANYCPLAFLEESGRNRTPDKLPKDEREALFLACDEALVQTVRLLAPRMVVGVGSFAFQRAQEALAHLDVLVGKIPHPSPASPQANKGWSAMATNALRDLGISIP